MKKLAFFIIITFMITCVGCSLDFSNDDVKDSVERIPFEDINEDTDPVKKLNDDEYMVIDALMTALAGNVVTYECDYDPATLEIINCSDINYLEDRIYMNSTVNKNACFVHMNIKYTKNSETINSRVSLFLNDQIALGISYEKGHMSSFYEYQEVNQGSNINIEKINYALDYIWWCQENNKF